MLKQFQPQPKLNQGFTPKFCRLQNMSLLNKHLQSENVPWYYYASMKWTTQMQKLKGLPSLPLSELHWSPWIYLTINMNWTVTKIIVCRGNRSCPSSTTESCLSDSLHCSSLLLHPLKLHHWNGQVERPLRTYSSLQDAVKNYIKKCQIKKYEVQLLL